MKAPFTVNLVVALEWILGCLLGFYSLMFLVFGFYGLLHFDLRRILTSLGVAILMGALAAAVFITGRSFRHGRKWAWRASWAIGILVAWFGWVGFLTRFGHRRNPGLIMNLESSPGRSLCCARWLVLSCSLYLKHDGVSLNLQN